MSEEPCVLVCARDTEVDTPIAGSVLKAADCGHNVWIAPSSLKGYEKLDREKRISCMACAGHSDASLVRRAQEGNVHAFKGVREEALADTDDDRFKDFLRNLREMEE